MGFMVDTGAQSSVLPEDPEKLSKVSWVQGTMVIRPYHWTVKRKVDLGTGIVFHSFLLVPDAHSV